MLAVLFNIFAIFLAVDVSFLPRVMFLIVIFEFVKNIDTLFRDAKRFLTENKRAIILSSGMFFYLIISVLWHDLKDPLYDFTISKTIGSYIYTGILCFVFLFYSQYLTFIKIIRTSKLFALPVFTVPLVLFIDFFTNFGIQKFLVLNNVGSSSIQNGMVFYALLCLVIMSQIFQRKEQKAMVLLYLISLITLINLAIITNTGKTIIIIFILSTIAFLLNIKSKNTKIIYHSYIGMILFCSAMQILVAKHGINLKLMSKLPKPAIYRECVWNTSFALYSSLPQKFIGHGLDSYKYFYLNEKNNPEKEFNKCFDFLQQIDEQDSKIDQKVIKKFAKKTRYMNMFSVHPNSIFLQSLFEFGVLGLTMIVVLLTLILLKLSKLNVLNKQNDLQNRIFCSTNLALFTFFFSLISITYSIHTFWIFYLATFSIPFCVALKPDNENL